MRRIVTGLAGMLLTSTLFAQDPAVEEGGPFSGIIAQRAAEQPAEVVATEIAEDVPPPRGIDFLTSVFGGGGYDAWVHAEADSIFHGIASVGTKRYDLINEPDKPSFEQFRADAYATVKRIACQQDLPSTKEAFVDSLQRNVPLEHRVDVSLESLRNDARRELKAFEATYEEVGDALACALYAEREYDLPWGLRRRVAADLYDRCDAYLLLMADPETPRLPDDEWQTMTEKMFAPCRIIPTFGLRDDAVHTATLMRGVTMLQDAIGAGEYEQALSITLAMSNIVEIYGPAEMFSPQLSFKYGAVSDGLSKLRAGLDMSHRQEIMSGAQFLSNIELLATIILQPDTTLEK